MKVLVVDYSSIREGAIRDARLERDQYNRNKLDRCVCRLSRCNQCLCKCHILDSDDGGDERVVVGYRNGDCWPLRSNMSHEEALDVLRHG